LSICATAHGAEETLAMTLIPRRDFLAASLGAAALQVLPGQLRGDGKSRPAALQIAPFRFDVTPPEGHSLCGGWIKPVVAVDDPLEAIGFVLLGAEAPIVLCAVDWTGLLNSAHIEWRRALAEAAGTTPERVAVQCVHQHDAPFACLDAQKIVAEQGDLPSIVDPGFFRHCLEQGQKAIATALMSARPVTHLAHGQGRVEKVASNRRFVGPDGLIQHWRGSSSRNPLHHELPEGLIDPWLKTVAFYDGPTKVAACHYYATHPMSHYGQGRVSSDFVGLARKRRQQEDPGCTHIYFTGCSGNVAAGKYNDGSPAARVQLTERIYQGLVASERDLQPRPIGQVSFRTAEVLPPPNPVFDAEQIEKQISDRKNKVVSRNRPAYTLAWIRRCEQQIPIVLSALHIDDVTLLHLPGESFIEYQLRAQQAAPDRFVATAAYGDGGPWYIPTAECYPQGGYEVSVAFAAPEIDPILTQGLGQLVGS
jgi:hypothetical protein